MIAEVIPIKRMPPHMGALTYLVRDEFQKRIAPGHLVTMPLRKSTIYGLVLSVRNEDTDQEVKPIESLLFDAPLVEESHLSLLNQLSTMHHVSLGTLASMSLLPMQKRKLANLDIPNIEKRTAKKTSSSISHYTSPQEHKEQLSQNIQGKTLILIPEISLFDEVNSLLSKEQKEKVIIWHSGLTEKEKFDAWLAIRNKSDAIILGTRGAVLLPIPELNTIIVDYEHNEQHKHWDQAPRFHASDVATLRACTEGLHIHFMSFSPSAFSYHDIHKKVTPGTLHIEPNMQPTVVNMQHERKGKNFDALSDKLAESIHASTGDIFLFIPKRGYARAIHCESCGQPKTCSQCQLPMIYSDKSKTLRCYHCNYSERIRTTCTTCGGALVQLRGRGTEAIEKEVSLLLKEKKDCHIIRIDGDSDIRLPNDEKRRIIIGTQMAFQYIQWEKTDLVGFIDIDMLLQIPEYLLEEQLWHHITEIHYRAPGATFVLQTHNPDHILFRSLKEPDRFYRTHLNQRKKLGYPPYAFLTRVFFGHPDIRVVKKQVTNMKHLLAKKLTDSQIRTTLSDPIEMHPRYYRGKFWYSILVRSTQNDSLDMLRAIDEVVPPIGWKVDPNPISILSP